MPELTAADRTALEVSRATIMAALAEQDRKEAANDLAALESVNAALTAQPVSDMVAALTEAVPTFLNPVRKQQVQNVVDVVTNVRATLTNFIAEATQLAAPPVVVQAPAPKGPVTAKP
jgi:hypothetical protein